MRDYQLWDSECDLLKKEFGDGYWKEFDYGFSVGFSVHFPSSFRGKIGHAVRSYGRGGIRPGDVLSAFRGWVDGDGVSKSENLAFIRIGKEIAAERRYIKRLGRALTEEEISRLGHTYTLL